MSQHGYVPKTLVEAVRHFTDPDVCHAYLANVKWPDGVVTCPRCRSDRVGLIHTRRMFQCKGCRRQFSVKVGTVFEDSPLGLDKWLVAVWCITNAKNGISSCELARALGVTQKTAWFMLHRVRETMWGVPDHMLTGTVESDESYFGGRAKNMHKGRRERAIRGTGGAGKTIVHGMLQRGDATRHSMIVASVVPDVKKFTLLPIIQDHVAPGTNLYTDASAAYKNLGIRFRRHGYNHEIIDHAKSFVEGNVHTNGLENFWSCFKRTIGGTYVSVDPDHLHRYLGEQVFRFNRRKENDGGRFGMVMPGAIGRRLTWKRLTRRNGIDLGAGRAH